MIFELFVSLLVVVFIAGLYVLIAILVSLYKMAIIERKELIADIIHLQKSVMLLEDKLKELSFDTDKFKGKDGLYSYDAYFRNINAKDEEVEAEAMRKAYDELED